MSNDATRLFVANLSFGATDASLTSVFSNYGKVVDAKIIFDKYTHRSLGFGFVTYSSPEEATIAKSNMHGTEVDGRFLRVEMAKSRAEDAK